MEDAAITTLRTLVFASKNRTKLFIQPSGHAELTRLGYTTPILRDAWGNACKDSNSFGIGTRAIWDLKVTISKASAGDMSGCYGKGDGSYNGSDHHGNGGNNDYYGNSGNGYNGTKQHFGNYEGGNDGDRGNNDGNGNQNPGSQTHPQTTNCGTKADILCGTPSGLVREKLKEKERNDALGALREALPFELSELLGQGSEGMPIQHQSNSDPPPNPTHRMRWARPA